MYLGYVGDKIKQYTEQPLDADVYGFTKVVYTEDKYVLSDDETEYVLYDEQKELAEAKKMKHKENDSKAEVARENQFFIVTIDDKECTFQTTRRTQQDLTTAKDFIQMTGQPYQWFSDNNEEVYLTLEEVVNISTIFMQKANIYPSWSKYETAINNATTIEEVQAIKIEYEEPETPVA